MSALRRMAKQLVRGAMTSKPSRALLKLADFQLAAYRPVQDPMECLADHLATVLSRLDINVVLDVGANKGQTGTLLRRIGYRGRIVSFEPVSGNYRALVERASGDPAWKCLPLALGASESEQQINLTRHSVFDSFLNPTDYSLRRFGGDSEVIGSEVVRVRRLDEVFDECTAGIAAPRIFLKLDTQGYDSEVLSGASGCLSQVLGLQTELSLKPVYVGMVDYLEVLPRLQGLGFEVSGMFPVNRDGGLRVIEFDCVAVRG